MTTAQCYMTGGTEDWHRPIYICRCGTCDKQALEAQAWDEQQRESGRHAVSPRGDSCLMCGAAGVGGVARCEMHIAAYESRGDVKTFVGFVGVDLGVGADFTVVMKSHVDPDGTIRVDSVERGRSHPFRESQITQTDICADCGGTRISPLHPESRR